jgi:RHS repeat-associated protein
MSARVFALGGALVALVPVVGSAPGHSVRALAPLEVLADGLDEPSAIAVDSDDNVFVADRTRGTVIRVRPDGSRTVVARQLKRPSGVAVDAEARVLVTEEGTGRLLRLGDGAPVVIASGLVRPRAIAVGDNGAVYVVARAVSEKTDDDAGGDADQIIAVAPGGAISVFADGLQDVAGIVTDPRAVYVAARTGSRHIGVRRYAVLADGRAGSVSSVGPGDVVAQAGGLARDRLGALWLSARDADLGSARLRDVVVKLTGNDATVFAHGLDAPHALAFGPEGHLYVIDAHAGRVLRFSAPAPPALGNLAGAVATTALPLSGSAAPGSRIDVFVNDADAPATTAAGADGHFATVVVIAQNTQSHLEAFATAARGQGLSSAPTLRSVVHDGDEPDLVFVRPLPAAFVRRGTEVEARARDHGTGIKRLSIDAGGRTLAAASPPVPVPDTTAAATWDTAGTADGATTLIARAIDDAGNTRTAARVVIVDNTAPEVQIAEGPSTDVSAPSVEFRFTGTDNLTPSASLGFAWRLDGHEFGAFQPVTSVTVGPLSAGPHRFEVKARDLAGNESPIAASQSFVVSLAPSIREVFPASGVIGAAVTVVGNGLAPGPVSVAFNGVAGIVRRLSPESLLTSVPPGATSGPLTVMTTRGAATHDFTVDTTQAIGLRALPRSLRTVRGLPVTATIVLDTTGVPAFSGLAALRVQQVPAAVNARLDAGALTGSGSTTLTLTPATADAASGTVIVEATAIIDGAVVRRATTVELDIVPGEHTALGGRLLLGHDSPIAGAHVTLAGTTLETDAGGNFFFLDPPPGRHMLGVDAHTARAGLPIYAIDVDLVGGRATRVPPLRITPPPPSERFVAIDNGGRDQLVTDARFRGFALTLPAGTAILGWDGVPKQRIAVERLTADALPIPPPEFRARVFYQIFFGTPMGGLPSKPLPIALPNEDDLAPGEAAELWYYDAAPIPGAAAGWRLAGDATVSADGTQVVSNPGVGLARFCGVCGIACIKRKVAGQPNIDLNGVRAGDPVDLATGLLILSKTDLALPGRIPAFVHRVYNAADPFGRVAGFELSTGPGWTLSVDVALIEDGPEARTLIMPGNARLRFARDPDGAFRNLSTPHLAGAALTAEAAGEHRLLFKDGASWRFRAGWRPRGRPGLVAGLGLLVEQRDRHGNILSVDRDSFGAVASIAEPAGRTLTFTTALLDGDDPASARLVTVLDPLGRMVHYGYDAARRLTTVTDAAGGIVRYAYDTAGRITTIIDPRGITYLASEYDAASRVVRQVQADGGVWQFDYEGPVNAHTRVTVTDPRGGATSHVFAGGQPIAIVDALGQVTRQERDAGGRVTAVVDALGRTVRFAYDARGNLARLTDPTGHPREIEYDDADRPRAFVDALGASWRMDYDAAGRLAAAVGPEQQHVQFAVDDRGQPVAVTDAAGQTTRLEYARTGEVLAVVDPEGRRMTLEYDAASRLVRRRDPMGSVVSLAYDALDRVVQVADAAGVVRYAYDPNGNLVTVTDPLGRVVRYAYDAMDRRVAKTDATGLTERYEYDAMGNLVRMIDRKGQTSAYVYDLLGRRLSERYADGTMADFTYDGGGRLVRIAADGTAVLLEYDALDRLVTETTVLGTTRYAWDRRGRRTTMTRPDGTIVAYRYDAAGRLTRVARGTQAVELEYDRVGRRQRLRLPGSIDAEYRYDAASRMTGITYRRGERSLGALAYAYDAAGRRAAVSGSLASVVLPDTIDVIEYDEANRQRRAGDRLMSYDANGNLTALVDARGTRLFTWDARDRLTATTGPADASVFAYDALGRRTLRDAGAGPMAFGYDLTDVVEDIAPGSELTYLRGPAPDEVFAAGEGAALTDAAGSILRLVDLDGNVADVLAYEPFGRASATIATTRYGFTGRERETDDLYYYRARYYHAGLGRFISEDPLGLAGGINAYVYALNDPVNLVDPTGFRTYVLHGIWPDRQALEDFASELRSADPRTAALPWNGQLFGGVLPSTHAVAEQLMQRILAGLEAEPLEVGEKLNLVGFSGGGLMASTLADMLRARGVKVDTVITLGTPAQTPITTTVPPQTRLINFVGVADPLASFRLHPRGTNYAVLATHTARSYTENSAVLSLIKREIGR